MGISLKAYSVQLPVKIYTMEKEERKKWKAELIDASSLLC